MRVTALAVVAAAMLAATAATPSAPALAQEQEGTVVGRPDLELSATDNRFGAGEQATLEVFVSNSGDLDRGGPAEYERRVTTARNVRLDVDESRMSGRLARNVEVQTGTVFAGSVPEGVSGPYAFNLEIADSLSPGTYELPVEVSYDYTNFVRYGPGRAPEYGDASRSTTAYVTVVVEDQPRFAIRAQNLTRVTAGDTTTYRLNLTNTGTQPAVDAQVTLSAANSSVFFGGGEAPQQRTSVFVDRLDPGASRTFEVTVGASADTAPGTYLANAVVAYETPNGVSGRSKGLTFGVAVGTEQTFALRGVDGSLRVGDAGLVTGRVENTGDTNVSDAVVVLASNETDLRPRSTEVAVGRLAPGESADFSFRIDTANTTDPGPRQVSFRVRYRNAEGETRRSDPIDARVAVAREQSFAVNATATGLQVGDRGTVSGTVVNTGETNASDAVVVLRTEGTTLQPRTTEFAVGTLAPGESADFSFDAAVPNDTDPGVRQVSFRIRYRNDQGETRVSDSLPASVRVGAEQTFRVEDVTGDLRVGDAGDLVGEVVNAGDRPVSNAVVVLRTNNPTLDPRETEYAVGRLAAGESAPFEFTVDVTGDAEAGPRQVSFRVRYRNREGDLRLSDSADARVEVAEDVDEFRVEPVEATLPAGDSTVVAFRVTNAANETLRDVEAKLFASDPLSTDNDEAFVSRLEPDESTVLRFGLGAAGGAIPKTYPVSVDFTYENARGDTVLSDTYRVPIEVVEPEGRGLPLPTGGVAPVLLGLGAVVVLGAVVWWKHEAIARLLS
ncbi:MULTISPECIES: COG1361 S-layer family protein [Halorussus]|uniref:COG1361 S-layer family protein n=1 Tax=Halorussus TaxID=1070314 RepID=UPI000E21A000|nr:MULTISPECIES: DUF11 domain-containing protein [Halorussus]NHN58745.1 DUF11 domain-containing protein [Halorussus sp. JP-T4]